MKDETAPKTRYRLTEFRFLVTLGLDCLLLTKLCTIGCFQFTNYKNMVGSAVCKAIWHLPIELFLDVQGFIALMAIALFAAVYLPVRYTCLASENSFSKKMKVLYGFALLLSLSLIIVMFIPITQYLQASMWITLIPFTICTTLSILYLVKGTNKTWGIIALVTVPLQMIILWSLIFNKFVLICYAKTEFNILNSLFTVNEILIVLEGVITYKAWENVKWTMDIDRILKEVWQIFACTAIAIKPHQVMVRKQESQREELTPTDSQVLALV